MAISLNKLVSVNGSVINAGFNAAALINNVLTENILLPADANRTKSFTSTSAVGDYFGLNSNEYIYASTYFKGYTNSRAKPRTILFSRYVTAATAAYMFSASKLLTPVVAAIKALASPVMTCNINGLTQTLVLLQSDFASATGLTDIATVIQTKLAAQLSGCTCTIIGDNQFLVKAPTASAASTTIGYCTGNVATLLKLTQATAPVLSQGTAAMTPAENMAVIKNKDANWVALSYCARLTGDDSLDDFAITVALTAWISTQDNNYVGLWWESGTDPLNIASTTNLRAVLVDNGFGTTVAGKTTYNCAIQVDYNGNNLAGTYNSVTTDYVGIYSGFWAGIGASVNYALVNSKVNFAGKRQDGLATNVDNDADYDALIAQGYNVYGNFAARASSYQMTEAGTVGGIYLFLDNLYDSVWMADQLQNSVANLIANTGRIPYNNDGKASITAVLTNVAQSGKNNGVIESGNTFDESQKQAVIELVGSDITPQLTTNGYYIYIAPFTPSQRSQRNTAQVSFIYTNGGAINSVAIGMVFVS